MADCEYENVYPASDVVKIQAWFRGILTRQSIKQTREEYEKLFDEIEQNIHTAVWKSDSPCRPCIKKTKEFNRNIPKISYTDQKSKFLKQDSDIQTEYDIHVQTKRNHFISNESAATMLVARTETDLHQSESNECFTVQTQTSFCEPCFLDTNCGKQRKEFECQTDMTWFEEQSETNQKQVWDKVSVLPNTPRNDKPFLQGSTEITENITDIHLNVPNLPLSTSSKENDVNVGMTYYDQSSEGSHPFPKPEVSNQNDTKHNCALETQQTGSSMSPRKLVNPAKNETSVWDSFHSVKGQEDDIFQYPSDQTSLQEMRKNIAMELLWVQQAINSRKNYLRLKDQISV